MHFSPRINLVYGHNGAGKTNLLDAIYYLCFCKSNFSASDANNIRHTRRFFRLEGAFVLKGISEHITAKVSKGRRKEMERNKIPYARLSQHIGLLPLIMIAPDDIELIKEGSEIRRKMLDALISQFNAEYLQNLIEYNKTLAQRNALLKRFADENRFDATLLEVYDNRMAPLAQEIHKQRARTIKTLQPFINQCYRNISAGAEEVGCDYKSSLKRAKMETILKRNLTADRMMQRTTDGIHRDDLPFTIGGYSLKKFGSQGQQKSFLIALKLAHYRYLAEQKNSLPILLLDDIFAKLDENRIAKLLQIVADKEQFGQIFITDTRLERMTDLFDKIGLTYKAFGIENGIVSI